MSLVHLAEGPLGERAWWLCTWPAIFQPLLEHFPCLKNVQLCQASYSIVGHLHLPEKMVTRPESESSASSLSLHYRITAELAYTFSTFHPRSFIITSCLFFFFPKVSSCQIFAFLDYLSKYLTPLLEFIFDVCLAILSLGPLKMPNWQLPSVQPLSF